MRPTEPNPRQPDDLFRARLSEQIDRRHPLVRLAGLIDWGVFEDRFGKLYHPHVGRPGIPIRLMVGLSYLQHTFRLSDQEVVARWVENPYWQYFCGFDYLQLELPIDRARWCAGGSGSVRTASSGCCKRRSPPPGGARRSNPKASSGSALTPRYSLSNAHPGTGLFQRGREILVRLAKRHGVPLRQSYARLGKKALRLASRYAHARQMKRARREIKRLKTYLGRVFRDVRRRLEVRPEVATHFAAALARVERLLVQQRHDKNKLYALHAPEVACIAKGKAHKKYEFGAKVAVAVTNREGLVVGMQAHPGNPYDGQTLAPMLDQVTRLTGVAPARCYVDRGYRGHKVEGATAVFVAGQRRGITPTIRRELRRRSAIEAMIGHMKLDGRLARNHLAGAVGDAIHALLCGAGHNLRLLLRHLARLLRALLRLRAVLAPDRDITPQSIQKRLLQGRLAIKDAARAPAHSAQRKVSGLRPCWSLRDRPLCSTPAARPQGRRAPQPNLLQHEADPSREVAMQQHQGQSLSQRFQQYRPSKTALFWSCGGCVVLATIVGFSWGGWTTGGTAREMAEVRPRRRARSWLRWSASTASWPRRTWASN